MDTPLANKPVVGKLTDRQRQVMFAIERHIAVMGYPPTRRWLASELGMKSLNAISEHLERIQRKGYIEISMYDSRAIKVLQSLRLQRTGTVARMIRCIQCDARRVVTIPWCPLCGAKSAAEDQE